MIRQPITVKKVVTLMQNPHPTYVSLVGHGANQTPFKAVKFAELPAPTEPTQKTEDMSKPSATAVVNKGAETQLPTGTDIHKIVFSGSNFSTVEDVNKYMTSKGYSGFAVDQIDQSFVVKAIDETAFETVTTVAASEGVTFFVGKLITAANPPVPVNAVEAVKSDGTPNVPVTARSRSRKSTGERPKFTVTKGDTLTPEALVKKYVGYFDEDDLTVAGCLEDITNGLPLGYWDVSDAYRYALRARIAAGDIAGISAISAEFGQILTKLVTLTNTVEKSEDRLAAFDAMFPTQKALGTQVPMMLGIPLSSPTDGIAQPGTLPAAPVAPNVPTTGSQPGINQPGTNPAPAGAKPNVDTNPQEPIAQPGTCPAPAGSTTLPTGGTPVTITPEKFGEILMNLQNTLTQLVEGQRQLTTKTEEVSTRVAKSEERLTTIERVRQARKSADTDEVQAPVVSNQTEGKPMSKVTKNLLGLG